MITALLDTNILIAFEDPNKALDEHCAEILRNAPSDIGFYYHPIQLKDIERDKDEERKKQFLSRIARYKPLNQAPVFDDSYFDEKGWANNSENDFIDNTLLACVVEPVVELLVTNDKRILSKAKNVGVQERVFNLESFEFFINSKPEPPELAYVQEEQCHMLDIDDVFFDSLRASYSGFNEWLEKCSRKQRKCWTIRKDGELAALCIYKEEDESIIDDKGNIPNGPVLKLCTFKVGSETYGLKMGERLLHMAFSYASQQGFNFIYLTLNEADQSHLSKLLTDFGFKAYGHYQGDRVMGKYLKPQTKDDRSLPKSEYVARFYPSFKDDSDVKKFLVPIKDQYHERLFPDISNLRDSLFGESVEMYGSESNTIRKAYLCNSSISKIEPGDILLFYRSHDRQSIEVLGIVREVYRSNSRKEIFDIVKGRTVYTIQEIDNLTNYGEDEVLVLFFDLIKYLPSPITLKQLHKIGMAHPQSISEISTAKYDLMMKVQ